MMKKKIILVTGSNGFIGKNLVEYLSKKYIILAPTHQELDLINNNVVENYFKNNSIDIVIHCAALGVKRNENQLNFFESNLRMFINLERCNNYYKKMIFLGSGAEYDKSKNLINVSERDFDISIPKDSYGFYKYVCSKIIDNPDSKVINLRLFGVFGKYEDYQTRFISDAILNAIKGKDIVINKNVFFDYLYITDLLKIIEYFIENNLKYKVYNIGRGKKIDLLSIAKKIKSISGKNINIITKNSGLNFEYSCDISRLKSEIKNLKFTHFDKSLTELYTWYTSNKTIINNNKL